MSGVGSKQVPQTQQATIRSQIRSGTHRRFQMKQNEVRMTKLTAFIPEDDARLVRVMAAMEGRSISDVVLGLIRSHVAAKVSEPMDVYEKGRTAPPVTVPAAPTPVTAPPAPPVTAPPPVTVPTVTVQTERTVSPEPTPNAPASEGAGRSPRHTRTSTYGTRAVQKLAAKVMGKKALTVLQVWELCQAIDRKVTRSAVSGALTQNRDYFEAVGDGKYKVRDIVLGPVKPPTILDLVKDSDVRHRLAALLSLHEHLRVPEIETFLTAYGMPCDQGVIKLALEKNPSMFESMNSWRGWRLIP